MSRTIATAGLGAYTNDIETKGQQILTLVKTYIPGFAGRYYGYQSLGRADVSYPALFVEPMGVDFQMVGIGKTELWITYMLEWYILENQSSDAVTLCTSAGDALKKLFSNNALGASITGSPDNRFKNNPGYWIYSEMIGMEIGRSLRNPTAQSEVRYMRAGRMRFKVQDVFTA